MEIKPWQVDGHLHTIFSDGDDTPEEIVELCVSMGIKLFAVTDHDTIDGIPQAITAAKRYKGHHIESIKPANAEFTSFDGKTIHVLGYCFRAEDEAVNRFFDAQRKSKQEYAEKVVNALIDLGFEISINDVSRFAHRQINDLHIYQAILSVIENSKKKSENARILRKNNVGTFSDFNQIFLKGLITFQKKKYATKDVIKMIQNAGGYAIWAHPFPRKQITKQIAYEKAIDFQKMGIDGIEVFYSKHNEIKTKILHEIAQELDVYETFGSDYHSLTRRGESRTIGKIKFYGIKVQDMKIFFPL